VIFCTKQQHDDYFERYMSKIRYNTSAPLIRNREFDDVSEKYLKTADNIDGKREKDLTEQILRPNKKHYRSDSDSICDDLFLSSSENLLALYPNGGTDGDQGVSQIVSSRKRNNRNVAQDVTSKMSADRQKRLEFSTPYTWSQSSVQSGASNASKSSRTEKSSAVATDNLFVVGSPLSSSRSKMAGGTESTSFVSSWNRTGDVSSSLLRQRRRVVGVNFHPPSSSSGKRHHLACSDEDVELVTIRQMSSVRPATAKVEWSSRKQSTSARRGRIGELMNLSSVKNFQFPGEDVRRAVIAKFAQSTSENETLWGGALKTDVLGGQREENFSEVSYKFIS